MGDQGISVSHRFRQTTARATQLRRAFGRCSKTVLILRVAFCILCPAWIGFGGLEAAPANNGFASAIALPAALPISESGTNSDATAESGEPDNDGHTPASSVWWEWTPVADALVQVDTFGSSFDTLLAVYAGDTLSELVPVASNDNGGSGQQSRLVFGAVGGTTYHIAVDGASGAEGNISLNLSEPEDPPVLVSLNIAPGVVDVETTSQVVQVEVTATDALAGVEQIWVDFYGSDSNYRGGAYLSLDSGTAGNGAWVGMLTVPVYSTPDTWTATVVLSDYTGATARYGDHGDIPIPPGSDTELEVVNDGAVDAEAPQLVAFNMAPTSVDVTYASQQMVVEIDFTDNLSGLQYLFLDFYDSHGDRVALDTSLHQVEGTATGGKWAGSITIPRFTAPDTWDAYVYLSDEAGNAVYLAAPFPGDPLGQIEVLNSGVVDTRKPRLLTLAITPTAVDVTSGQQDVTLVATASDDSAGVDEVYANFYNDADEYIGYIYFNRTTGTPTNGTWEAVLTVPPFTAPGTWHAQISVRDQSEKRQEYSDVFSYNVPLPDGATGAFDVLNSGPVDETPPVLTAFTITPGSVDVTSGQQQVTITADATDDVAGVRAVYANFFGADSSWHGGTTLALVGGAWEGVFTVPQYAAPSTWHVQFAIPDFANNYSYYSNLFSSNEPLPGGGSGELAVLNSGVVDTEPPRLLTFALTPNTVDVWSSPQDVMITVDLSDDGVGVDQVYVEFYNEAQDYLGFASLPLVSGTAVSGTWEGAFTVPQGTPFGALHARINASDLSGKYGTYSNLFGYDSSLPGGASGVVEVVAPVGVDIAPPVLLSISISPDNVDVTSGEQHATITVEASDDLSGIEDIYMEFYDDAAQPVGSAGFHRTAGPATNGTWEGDLTVYPFTAPGTWHARVYLTDYSGKGIAYGNLIPGDEILPGGASGELEVFNTGDIDEIAPVLNAFTITPGTVDVTTGAQQVLLTADATDDVGGVRFCYVNFWDASHTYLGYRFLTLGSGTSSDGTWEAELTVPQYLAPQIRYAQFVLFDFANNYSQYSSLFSGDQDLPGGGSGQLVILNAGGVDTGAPQLTSIQFTPGAVNAGESAGVTITATDDLSGVQYARIDFYNSLGIYLFTSGLGLDSGVSTNGTWVGTAYIPAEALSEVWDSVVILEDGVGNAARYGPSQSGLNFPGGATGQLAIIGAPTETLASFAEDHLLEGAAAEFDANTDGDAAILLFEYAFHLDPTIPDAEVLTPDTGEHGLPWVGLHDLGGGVKVLEVQYLRRLSAADLTYVVEFGSDLSNAGPGAWEPASNPETTESIDAEWERVTVRDSETSTTEHARFGRVSVTADAP